MIFCNTGWLFWILSTGLKLVIRGGGGGAPYIDQFRYARRFDPTLLCWHDLFDPLFESNLITLTPNFVGTWYFLTLIFVYLWSFWPSLKNFRSLGSHIYPLWVIFTLFGSHIYPLWVPYLPSLPVFGSYLPSLGPIFTLLGTIFTLAPSIPSNIWASTPGLVMVPILNMVWMIQHYITADSSREFTLNITLLLLPRYILYGIHISYLSQKHWSADHGPPLKYLFNFNFYIFKS